MSSCLYAESDTTQIQTLAKTRESIPRSGTILTATQKSFRICRSFCLLCLTRFSRGGGRDVVLGGDLSIMISQTVEYALRAVVTIAQNKGAPCTAQRISELTKVPGPYLSKMMQGLARARVVTSKRGLHGGFLLTKDPADLTIAEVIDAVEPFKRIRECPLGINGHQGTLCPLHRRLDQAMALVEESFQNTTVADVLSHPGSVTPLCEEQNTLGIRLSPSHSKNRS